MNIFPIVIIVIVLALVIIYVTRPLFSVQAENEELPAEDRIGLMQAEYNALLERIRELDFDANLGKLTPQEHNEQRDELINKAAALLREIQAQHPSQPPSAA